MSRLDRLVLAVDSRVPLSMPADADLDRSLAFVGRRGDSEAYLTTAALALAAGAVAAGVAQLRPVPAPRVVGGLALLAGAVGAYGVARWPAWAASVARARSLGAIPRLVGLATLRMANEPTLEGAMAFAARHADGPLAESLAVHRRRALGRPATGWTGFAEQWAEFDPSVTRVVGLLEAAASASPEDRRDLLDRAFDAAVDGVEGRMAAYASSMRGPTSALYAFGVVVPLALVAAVPAASRAGVVVGTELVVAIFDVALPVGLLAASVALVARRPAAFPAVPVDGTHPSVPDRRPRVLAALVAGLAVAWTASRVVPDWSAWLLAPGLGIGGALVAYCRPGEQVRRRVDRVEAGLTDALVVVGQQLQRGTAVERAVHTAGEQVGGPAGEVFRAAAGRQRRLGVDVREAFCGRHGPATRVPSPALTVAARLVAVAGSQGRRGGALLVALAEHLDRLRDLEQSVRNDLRTITGTLRSTAWCFGPLVGGVTVALAGRLEGQSAAGAGHAPSQSVLGLAVGGYVLLLAVILAGLATALEDGLDRSRVGLAAGRALVLGSVVFVASASGAAALL